jgi:hypothetical protein
MTLETMLDKLQPPPQTKEKLAFFGRTDVTNQRKCLEDDLLDNDQRDKSHVGVDGRASDFSEEPSSVWDKWDRWSVDHRRRKVFDRIDDCSKFTDDVA